jgi:hypothetical protein
MTACTGCHADLPPEAFGFKNKAKGRRDSRCRQCRSAYTKQHYRDNKDRYRANSKQWRKAHKAAATAISRRYLERNPEKAAELAARKKAQREAAKAARPPRIATSPEELAKRRRLHDLRRRENGYFAQWKKRNKDKVNASTARRRQRIKEANGGHHRHDVQKLLRASGGRCYWCRQPFGAKFEVDHVWPVALGGDDHIGNLCLACPSCNRRKSKKAPTELGVLL